MDDCGYDVQKHRAYSFSEMIDRLYANYGRFMFGDIFAGASAYLNGFVGGLLAVDPNMATEWMGFADEWLPRKLGYPRNAAWCFELSKRYPDALVALEQLRLLYAEYIAETRVRDKVDN